MFRRSRKKTEQLDITAVCIQNAVPVRAEDVVWDMVGSGRITRWRQGLSTS